MDISVKALEEAVSIRRQIDNLERRLSSILRGAPARPSPARPSAARPTAAPAQAGRYFSPSTRAKLSAAARARWAKLKGGTKPAPAKKKGALTAAGRRKLSELMKARWAARRKSAGTKAAPSAKKGGLTPAGRRAGKRRADNRLIQSRRLADSFRFQKRSLGTPRHCSREDSNLHGFPHTVLSRTRLPIPPREQNQWSLQCARASPLQGQTGATQRKKTRYSEVSPNLSSVRELPIGALCVPGQASVKGRHNWIRQSRNPSKVYPSPVPKS